MSYTTAGPEPSNIDSSGGDGADYSNAKAPGSPGSYPRAKGGKGATSGKGCKDGTNGDPGTHGKPGIAGENGGKGGNGSQAKFTTKNMTGHYTIKTDGGKGGGGGPGGPGGPGQDGGPGGSGTKDCKGGKDGAGGDGGVGGNGGNAGNGGDGGQIYITFSNDSKIAPPTFSYSATGGKAGLASTSPGKGGPAGKGDPPGGSLGSGKNGLNATAGKGGQVYVNGKAQVT